MEYFNNLPEEITLYVLTRLPTDSILICKLVCRTSRNLISHHPLFSKMHLHNLNNPSSGSTDDADSGKVLSFIALIQKNQLHYFEMDDENNLDQSTTRPIQRIRRVNLKLPIRSVFMLGCCNGLVCIGQFSPSGTKPYICNPITKEFLMLPETNTDYCDSDDVYMEWGFGHVSHTDEYKVVGIHVLNKEFVQVHVYTLGSGNGWRNLGEFNLESSKEWGQGIFVNGVIYWLDKQSGMVLTFDLAKERFCGHLSPPPLQSDHGFCFDRLGVLDGLLYLAVWLLVEGVECYELWLLKRRKIDDHDMKGQKEHKSWFWSKEFRVDVNNLITVTKTGDVLTYKGNFLYSYDPKASTSKMFVDFKELIRRVLPHKNTFLSLKELGEEGTKIMKSIEVAEETESIDHPLKQLAIGG